MSEMYENENDKEGCGQCNSGKNTERQTGSQQQSGRGQHNQDTSGGPDGATQNEAGSQGSQPQTGSSSGHALFQGEIGPVENTSNDEEDATNEEYIATELLDEGELVGEDSGIAGESKDDELPAFMADEEESMETDSLEEEDANETESLDDEEEAFETESFDEEESLENSGAEEDDLQDTNKRNVA